MASKVDDEHVRFCTSIAWLLNGQAQWQLTSVERRIAEDLIKKGYLKLEQRDGVMTLIKT